MVNSKGKPAPGRGGLTLENLPESMSVREAAATVKVHYQTIYKAIREGKLKAVLPAGAEGKRGGRFGYRISAAALQAWYFNDPSLLGGES